MHRWFVQISTAVVLSALGTTCPKYSRAQPGPIPSLRRWVDASTLIVKGRVLKTRVADQSDGLPESHRSVATVRIESLLKGKIEASVISIEYQELTRGYGANTVYQNVYSPHPGDGGILFLKRDKDGRLVFANSDRALLHTAQNAPRAAMAITTMSKLEAELIASVSDPLYGPEAAQLLDTVERCPAVLALRGETNPQNPDPLIARAYAGLIRCGDYSSLTQAIELAQKPTGSQRLWKQQAELAEAIGEIGDNRLLQVMKPENYKNPEVCASRSNVPIDSSILHQLHPLLFSWHEDLSRGVAHALRGICAPASAPYLADALDLADLDVQYDAMMALAAVEGFPKERPAPTAAAFKSDPAKFATPWRNWWSSVGKREYGADTYDKALRLQVTVRSDTLHSFSGMAESHGMIIINLSNGPITIERGIRVEYQTPSGWVHGTSIEAVSNCEVSDPRSHAPVRIDAHATLAVVSWNGWACGGQCPTPCQQNAPAMPGTYRFVLTTVPDARRIISRPFQLRSRSINGKFSALVFAQAGSERIVANPDIPVLG
jgi:hypothetical protein